MNDQALDETTPGRPGPSSGGTVPHGSPTTTPFGDPTGVPAEPHVPARQWSIEDILATAKTPEKHARVCLRADLQAEHDQILAELSTLVDARGEVLDDGERSNGETSKAARAQELSDRLTVVRGEMAKAMWFPLFRGLTTDALGDFNKQHKPKDENPVTMAEYNTILVAECSVASSHGPKLTVDDVRALRKKLGSRAVGSLVATAHEVCTLGGADVPKLPASWVAPKPQ